MSHNPDVTHDDIYDELRADNEDSINFFQGSEIVILHKNISEPVDEETEKQMAGLENLIKSFAASEERILFNQMLAGNEALSLPEPKRKQSVFIKIIDEVIKFLKDVANWIFSLLTNRIARTQNKLYFLEHKRKVNGIKTSPVKYLMNISSLMMPMVVTESPVWVLNAAKIGLDFYKKTILGHKKLIDAITARPSSREELQQQKVKVLESVGRIITDGKVTHEGFTTDILPGNKLFNIATKTTERNGSPFYFITSPTLVKLRSETWTPTSSIIDSGISVLNDYITEIKKEQANTNTLNRNFEKNIRAAKKDANSWTVAYYNWLIEIHRKLISLTFQHTMRWYDALENFVSSGIKA